MNIYGIFVCLLTSHGLVLQVRLYFPLSFK